ncbi:MAG: hypothetical protein ACTS6G_04830 [Candidatus Hodgkinia cicadicola]
MESFPFKLIGGAEVENVTSAVMGGTFLRGTFKLFEQARGWIMEVGSAEDVKLSKIARRWNTKGKALPRWSLA